MVCFPILIKNNKISRNELINYLEENGIKTRLIFAGNLIKQPYMKEQNYIVKGKLKKFDKVMRECFLGRNLSRTIKNTT